MSWIKTAGIWLYLIPTQSCDYLKAKAVALVQCFSVEFLNVGFLRLVHVGKVARVETFIYLADGVVHVISKVHHFFLQTFRHNYHHIA